MKHIITTFFFPVELGVRLRELRGRVGLSLEELARRMGRRPGYHHHLGRLEAGRLRFPTLALVTDYLRACRASVADIAPFLDRYAALPPVREDAARESVLKELAVLPGRVATALDTYDVKTAGARQARGEKPLAPARRAEAVGRQAQAALERRGLDAVVTLEVNRLDVRPTLAVRKVAFDYARMLWRVLKQTRPRPRTTARGRPRKSREQRLAEARAAMQVLAGDIIPVKGLNQIRDCVLGFFEKLYRADESES